MTFLLLIGLGLITYTILQRSVANITRTPVWLLWLVMMTPAIVLVVWSAANGENDTVPASVAIALVTVCFLIYLWLLYLGRLPANSRPSTTPPSTATPQAAKTPPSLTQLRPIAPNEENRLRDCFNWSIYALHNLEYRPQAVICRGQLRTHPDRAYRAIREKIEQQFGDRFLVVLQEGPNQKPLFVLAPNPHQQSNSAVTEPRERPIVAWGLLLVTFFTTSVAGAEFAGVTPESWQSDPNLLVEGFPYALSIMAILGLRELGHYLVARRHQLRVTLPYFIPIPFFLGTLGAFLQLRSPIPNRKVLFDVSVIGPVIGFLTTLPLLIWGLAHSELVDVSEEAGLLNFEALQPTFSLLLSFCCGLVLDGSLDASKAIDLHPMAIAGYLGLILTAFNLMPIGQLEGGHMVHAMFGRRTALAVGQVTRLLMLVLSLIHPELFLWTLLLFLMPLRDDPALNDVSELDNTRDLIGLLSLAVLASILLPAPRLLTQALSG